MCTMKRKMKYGSTYIVQNIIQIIHLSVIFRKGNRNNAVTRVNTN